MLDKKTIVKIANDLLQGKGDMSLWIQLVSEYCEEKDSSKASKIVSIFTSLPQEIQYKIIKGLIDYYCNKYCIFSVGVIDNDISIIFNGVSQTQFKPIYYYI